MSWASLLTLALRAPAPIASWTSLAGVSVGLVVCRVLLVLTFLVAALGRLSALWEKVPGGDGVLHVPVLRRLMKEEWLHVGAGRNKCPRKSKMGTCAVTQETSGAGSAQPVLTEDDEGVLVGAAKPSNCLSGVV